MQLQLRYCLFCYTTILFSNSVHEQCIYYTALPTLYYTNGSLRCVWFVTVRMVRRDASFRRTGLHACGCSLVAVAGRTRTVQTGRPTGVSVQCAYKRTLYGKAYQ